MVRITRLVLSLVFIILCLRPAPASASSLDGKVFAGYQGWFDPGELGGSQHWRHYGHNGKFGPGNVVFDLWPDVSELDPDERYPTPFHHPDGKRAEVFSSANPKTVSRHFSWMKQYGIDGVFLERFGVMLKDPGQKPFFDKVLENVRNGAQCHEREWTVMYDLSGLQKGDIAKYVIADWKDLVTNRKIRGDLLKYDGKPLVAIWGVGFSDNRAYSLEECRELVEFLKNDPEFGGNAIMLGVPYCWRTLKGDCMGDPAFHELVKRVEVISPWAVGRVGTPADALAKEKEPLAKDIAWLAEHKVDYAPVVFPGFSWFNLMQARGNQNAVLNVIPRLGGQFLWSQALAAKRAGSKMIFLAMFDEIDEGTAILKVCQNPPTEGAKFLTYEGLPSDHYLWLSGQIGKLLRGEIPETDPVPQRALP